MEISGGVFTGHSSLWCGAFVHLLVSTCRTEVDRCQVFNDARHTRATEGQKNYAIVNSNTYAVTYLHYKFVRSNSQ